MEFHFTHYLSLCAGEQKNRAQRTSLDVMLICGLEGAKSLWLMVLIDQHCGCLWRIQLIRPLRSLHSTHSDSLTYARIRGLLRAICILPLQICMERVVFHQATFPQVMGLGFHVNLKFKDINPKSSPTNQDKTQFQVQQIEINANFKPNESRSNPISSPTNRDQSISFSARIGTCRTWTWSWRGRRSGFASPARARSPSQFLPRVEPRESHARVPVRTSPQPVAMAGVILEGAWF